VESESGITTVTRVVETDNVARSSRVYEVDPRAMLRADREAEAAGHQLIGVYHSHTHTEAKPSPTDIRQAPDPGWHYVLVSLRDVHPSLRSWRIADGKIEEEPVVLEW
jgi:proteasome lid subunit RPN8/RPN11